MNYKLLLSILLLNITLLSFAQDKISMSLGIGSQIILSSDFKKFMNDYNEEQKAGLKNEMNMRGIPYNYQLNANYLAGKIGFCISYSITRTNYRATFNDETSRDIVIKNRTPIDVGFLLKLGEKGLMTFRFGYATSNLISQYVYADKTKSFNHTSPLNGVYHTFGSFMKLNFMVGISKNLKLDFGLTRFNGSSGYYDFNYAKGLGDGDFFYFPRDYKTYNNLYNNGTIYDFSIDKALNMKSFQLSAGLVYFLNFTK